MRWLARLPTSTAAHRHRFPGSPRVRPASSTPEKGIHIRLHARHVDTIFGAIGRFCVRFRWLVTLAWIAAAVAAIALLPALSSVTQSNNRSEEHTSELQ